MEESQMKEKEVVATSGTIAEIFAAQIKSRKLYNVYSVQPVLIKAIGESPIEVGDQVEAVNVAESFLYPGNAEIGLYVLVYVSQGRFVFWALGS